MSFSLIHNTFGKLNHPLWLWYSAFELISFACWWWYRFVKMPRWVELMPSIIRVNPRVLMSLTLLVLRQINPLHYNFFENEEWMKGYALRSGSRPWTPCVHAHGPDVELIMEASCDNNNPLVISSSGNYVCSFATVVLTMIVPLWFHFSDKLKHLSSADQCIFATSILTFLRVLPSGISRITKNCVASYESSSSIAPQRFQIAPGSELLVTREHR